MSFYNTIKVYEYLLESTESQNSTFLRHECGHLTRSFVHQIFSIQFDYTAEPVYCWMFPGEHINQFYYFFHLKIRFKNFHWLQFFDRDHLSISTARDNFQNSYW